MASAVQTAPETFLSSGSETVDLLLVGRTEIVDLEKYFNLPLDRSDIYRDLTQLRLTWFEGGFRPYLEVLNKALYGRFYLESSYPKGASFSASGISTASIRPWPSARRCATATAAKSSTILSPNSTCCRKRPPRWPAP